MPCHPDRAAEYEELVAAVLRFSTKPRAEWAHASIVTLAEAHAEDSQTMDRLQEREEMRKSDG